MAQADTRLRLWGASWFALAALGCSAEPVDGAGPLAINEVMTDNDAAWIDEAGQVEDWIEVVNRSGHALQLADYRLQDGRGRSYDFSDAVAGRGRRSWWCSPMATQAKARCTPTSS